MASNFTTNYIPVGIGYDADGNAKGLIELSSISVSSTTASSAPLIHTNVSADYSVVPTDSLIYVNATSVVTVTLPPVADSEYRVLHVYRRSTAHSVIIDGNSGDTINGATTASLDVLYENVTIHCDGVEWSII